MLIGQRIHLPQDFHPLIAPYRSNRIQCRSVAPPEDAISLLTVIHPGVLIHRFFPPRRNPTPACTVSVISVPFVEVR